MADNDDDGFEDDELAQQGEEEIALRRNQLLMLGVVLLGVFSICMAVSMPSDLDLTSPAIPSPSSEEGLGGIMDSSDSHESHHHSHPHHGPPILSVANLTNATRRKTFFKNPEDSVENAILRNIAIHNTIQGLEKEDEDRDNDENDEEAKIEQVVHSFMNTPDFEDFIIDIEITDAIRRLRREKGYKKRENTVVDDLFHQIERHFLGDNPQQVQFIRRVGEELERRARRVIEERRIERKEKQDHHVSVIADEIYNGDYWEDEEDKDENENSDG